jgi:hypothetical protein
MGAMLKTDRGDNQDMTALIRQIRRANQPRRRVARPGTPASCTLENGRPGIGWPIDGAPRSRPVNTIGTGFLYQTQ